MSVTRTRRWWIATVIAGVSLAVGSLAARPGPILVGAVGLGFLGGASLFAAPDPDLRVERTLSDPEPEPGAELEVTLTIHNDGGFVPDVRLVDGVPGELSVVSGSPRIATALEPGASTSTTYTILAERGQHGFDPATAVVRNPGGTLERTVEIGAETIFTCLPSVYEVPLRSQTSQLAGDLMTDDPGSGLEFHSIRSYRSGDALSRINWREVAKSGRLTTIQYREERAAAVMIVVDARPTAYWMGSGQNHHAVEHSVAAAGRVFGTLLDGGDRVGVTAFAADDVWVPPGAGNEHEGRVRHTLATHSAFSYTPPSEVPELAIHPDHDPIDTTPLLTRLRADNQLIVISPLLDDGIVEAVQDVHARIG